MQILQKIVQGLKETTNIWYEEGNQRVQVRKMKEEGVVV
jgi:hypothetical protein